MFRIGSRINKTSLPKSSSSIHRSRKRFSSSNEERRRILEQYAKKNNLTWADWYRVDTQDLDENTSQIFQKEFRGSMYRALSTIFPEVEWHPWKFKSNFVPVGFWNESTNQRKFFDDLGKEIGICHLDDWYDKLSTQTIVGHGGGGLLHEKHNNSAINALLSAYPEHNWLIWNFRTVPHHFWHSKDNQQKYFDWLGKKLQVKNLDGWYDKLSVNVMVENGSRGLLSLYKNSPTAALMAAYPDHKWIPWRFHWVPMNFWIQQDNKRKFFEYLAEQVGVQTLDDWYHKLSKKIIIEHGAPGLLRPHSSSPVAALMAAYPEHNWIPWKFNCMPKLWSSSENVMQFVVELSEKLSIQTLDDWYRVDYLQLQHFGAFGVMNRYKGLYGLLKNLYPNHPWDPKKFQRGKKGQRWLAVTLKKLFPDDGTLWTKCTC